MSTTTPGQIKNFALSQRIRRAVWNLSYNILIKWTPRPCHAWRAFVLRRFGARLGKNCHIYSHARIWAPWNLVCHDDAAIADDAIIYNMGEIVIGARSIISQGAHICAGSHDYTDPDFNLITKPIVIGADVWICAECFIHPGVTIGDGAVIGARSVVTKDMPGWMVCAGHPCIPMKPRVLRQIASEKAP